MPARATARIAMVGTASLTAVLLAGAPAFAASPQPGDPCVLDTVLDPGLTCTDGIVATVAPTADPAPPPDPTPSGPAPVDPSAPVDTPPVGTPPVDTPAPTDTPAPPVDTPTPVDTPSPVTTSDPGVGTTGPGTGTADPGTPGAPQAGGAGSGTGAGTGSGTGTPVGTGTSGGAKEGNTPAGTSLHAAATGKDPATTDKSMLTAATVATLAATDLPTLAASRTISAAGGHPLSFYTPSPELAAMPVQRALADVQAPLLAVGGDAVASGNFTLSGLSGKTLPGLLVVLGTGLVAAIGAANIRLWQDRWNRR